MGKLEIDKGELYKRILRFFECRDIDNGKGERTIPIRDNDIKYMAEELTRDICKSNEDYYDFDDFRNRA